MGFKPLCASRAPCTNYSRDKFGLTSPRDSCDYAGTRDFGSIKRVAITVPRLPRTMPLSQAWRHSRADVAMN